MKIVIIDGQGGKLGTQIVSLVKNKINEKNLKEVEVIAIGTNALATEAMLKAKADVVATGENPVVVCSRDADIIIGPIGIVIADSLYGEVTPKMAVAVGQADAVRILLPVNRCDNIIAGIPKLSVSDVLQDMLAKVKNVIS